MTRRRWSRRKILLTITGVIALLIVAAFGALYSFMKYSVLPLRDGVRLSNGEVTTVVTGHFGPVAIGAYVFLLNDGAVGLIDAGSDRTAAAIREALTRAGKHAEDVRAIFLTHAHDDHTGGARAFPRAAVYVLEPDRSAVERSGITVARGLRDGERMDVGGTPVEVFALPGHTRGSAAFLVHGVLFFGDSAAAAWDGSFQANTIMGSNPDETPSSLRALAGRLRSRRGEIRHLAFGHQGAIDGLDAMLVWADRRP